jgi:hypothetical protein
MDARYERRHLDRRLPSENDRIHGFFCACRGLLILCDLLQPAVAARRPLYIVRLHLCDRQFTKSLEDESEGQEQPVQPQRHAYFLTVIRTGYATHPRCGIPAARPLYLPKVPIHRPERQWQSYGLSDDGCHDRYGKQNRTYRHFAELHRAWRLVSAPRAAS